MTRDVDAAAMPPDPWEAMRMLTPARIALGRAGGSLPTAPVLAFQLAHAQARDAVHRPFDVARVAAALDGDVLHVHSAAPDRATYLRRPDLGRRLDASSRSALDAHAASADGPPYDVVFVIADGLSSLAAESHAPAVHALAVEAARGFGWRIAPCVVARQARVALGDEIAQRLRARQVAILIGERPGLSSADSLGVYITHAPRVGTRDAQRNCISNIRPGAGLDAPAAAHTLVWLLREARARDASGVALKDESARAPRLVRPA